MLIERFEEKGLSHYSYAVGCEEKGQIAIIDPRFDVDVYLKYAEEKGYVISHVLETHIHADYASGARYLAARARATLILSGYDKGEKYEVGFPHKECFDGDILKVGTVTLKVLHTPGHTPEHISFLANDSALFCGDFLFVGSVGRPDLLGDKNAEPQARILYQSICKKLKNLPNNTEVYPSHGAGSFCGSGMDSRFSSTLGQERLHNPYLEPNLTEDAFTYKLLASSPPRPDYFFRMKEYNISSERDQVSFPAALDIEAFQKGIEKGCAIVDLRDQKAFGAGHIPNSICIGVGVKVGFWASWVVPYDRPLLLVTDNPTYIQETINSLARLGITKVYGYLKGGIEVWKRADLPLDQTLELSPHEIEQADCQIVDVRSVGEWVHGHIQGAKHIPCDELLDTVKSLPEKLLVFVCTGGYRSILAASVAKKLGRKAVAHLPGGLYAWQAAGLALVSH